jgi:hypothetical protein
MPTVVQFRRGNTASVAAFTGANGEIIINTDTKVPFIQDGVTAGGYPLQRGQSAVRVDFGPNPVYTLSGTFSDSRATTNSTLTTVVSMYPSSANSLANGSSTTAYYGDELEFDNFQCSAYVSANGTIAYNIVANPGPVANTRIFNYILS